MYSGLYEHVLILSPSYGSPQWCYGFYLTHQQGQSGFELFFKTKDLKKKWLDQFEMAMSVWVGVGVGGAWVMLEQWTYQLKHP